MDFPATAKNLPSKISTLNNNANSVTAQPPKYHNPNVFLCFIRHKLAPQKFALCDIEDFVEEENFHELKGKVFRVPIEKQAF